MTTKKYPFLIFFILIGISAFALIPQQTHAIEISAQSIAHAEETATTHDDGAPKEAEGHTSAGTLFLWIAVLLIAAKSSSLIERLGQPAVLGELLIGIVLGNLALVGIHLFDTLPKNEILLFLAELGVVILLFQIGLESNIKKMRSVGLPATGVALIGVVVPFALGAYVVGPWLLPGLSQVAYLFLGAALTATSVGITARVFKDLKFLQTTEAQVVLGAAVIDDVLGLVILAIISAIATTGTITAGAIAFITFKALGFLVAAIFLGQWLAPHISRLFSKIHTGIGMKFTIAISFGLIFAYLAQQIGLAPIVGAFAAGLVLDAVCFRFFRHPEIIEDVSHALEGADERVSSRVQGVLQRHSAKHIDELIEPIAHFLVPIFFVLTGMSVDISLFANTQIIFTALGITIVAIVGKMVSSLFMGKTINKLIVGLGMVPRGEVGLIFATIGASLGVVTDDLFSVIVAMVILTTLITPPLLTWKLKRLPPPEESNASPTPHGI